MSYHGAREIRKENNRRRQQNSNLDPKVTAVIKKLNKDIKVYRPKIIISEPLEPCENFENLFKLPYVALSSENAKVIENYKWGWYPNTDGIPIIIYDVRNTAFKTQLKEFGKPLMGGKIKYPLMTQKTNEKIIRLVGPERDADGDVDENYAWKIYIEIEQVTDSTKTCKDYTIKINEAFKEKYEEIEAQKIDFWQEKSKLELLPFERDIITKWNNSLSRNSEDFLKQLPDFDKGHYFIFLENDEQILRAKKEITELEQESQQKEKKDCDQFLKDIKSNEWYWVWKGFPAEQIEIRKTAPELKTDDDGKIGVVNPEEKYWGKVIVEEGDESWNSSFVNWLNNETGELSEKKMSLSEKKMSLSEKIYLNLSVGSGERGGRNIFHEGRPRFASIETFHPEDNTACRLFRVKIDDLIQELIPQLKQYNKYEGALRAIPWSKIISKKIKQNGGYTYSLIIPWGPLFVEHDERYQGDNIELQYDTEENRKILDEQMKDKDPTVHKKVSSSTYPNISDGGDGLLENIVLKF